MEGQVQAATGKSNLLNRYKDYEAQQWPSQEDVSKNAIVVHQVNSLFWFEDTAVIHNCLEMQRIGDYKVPSHKWYNYNV